MTTKNKPTAGKPFDYSARFSSFMMGWGLPILAIVSLNFITIPIPAATLVIAGAFAWMGTGCILNARRCRRRHCYLSGPVLLLGALMAVLVGFKVVSFGPDGMLYVTWGTFILVGLTFVPEFIWGKYLK